MESWNLLEIDAPDGTRDPVVLRKGDEGRAVLIRIDAGQELGDHQVMETAWVVVVEGRVVVRAGDRDLECGPGHLFRFAPDERHAIRSDGGARILLLLAPWPGRGHYRGHESAATA